MIDADVRDFAPKASSSPAARSRSPTQQPPRAPQAVFDLGVPVLGICYGMQTMARSSAAGSNGRAHREFGYAQVHVDGAVPPARRAARSRDAQGRGVLDVWMSHGDRVDAVPPGFSRHRAHRQRAARGDGRRVAALLRRAVPSRGHAHACRATQILRRFVREICGCAARWDAGEHHRRTRSRACARRSAAIRCCSGCRAASIPRSSPRCCTGPSATS